MRRKTATTAQARGQHHDLTRYLYAAFRRKLTIEEVQDAASDAIVEADKALRAGQDIADMTRWLRRAGWRNALDAVRKIEGEGEVRRQRPVSLDPVTTRLVDPDDHAADADEQAASEADARELIKAFAVLRPEEQRILRLRFFDELEVERILEVVGCSRHQYENLHKRAIRKLREALVKGAGDTSCGDCRVLILQGVETALSSELVARRDAHVSACLTCRAFSLRQQGLIAALPLPAIPLADRVIARLQMLTTSVPDPAQHGEAVAGTVVAGTAAAGGGGAVAGGGATIFSIGGAAKTLAVVCSAGAVTATVCVNPLPTERPTRPAQHKAAKKPVRTVVARAATTKPPPITTAAASAPAAGGERRTGPTPTELRAAAQREARAEEQRRTRERERQREESSPFLPESAADPSSSGATGSTAVASAASTEVAAQPAATQSVPKSQPKTTFGGEFTP